MSEFPDLFDRSIPRDVATDFLLALQKLAVSTDWVAGVARRAAQTASPARVNEVAGRSMKGVLNAVKAKGPNAQAHIDKRMALRGATQAAQSSRSTMPPPMRWSSPAPGLQKAAVSTDWVAGMARSGAQNSSLGRVRGVAAGSMKKVLDAVKAKGPNAQAHIDKRMALHQAVQNPGRIHAGRVGASSAPAPAMLKAAGLIRAAFERRNPLTMEQKLAAAAGSVRSRMMEPSPEEIVMQEQQGQLQQHAMENEALRGELEQTAGMAEQHAMEADEAHAAVQSTQQELMMAQQVAQQHSMEAQQAMMQAQQAQQETAMQAQQAAQHADGKMRLGIRIQQMRQQLADMAGQDPVAEEGEQAPPIQTAGQQQPQAPVDPATGQPVDPAAAAQAQGAPSAQPVEGAAPAAAPAQPAAAPGAAPKTASITDKLTGGWGRGRARRAAQRVMRTVREKKRSARAAARAAAPAVKEAPREIHLPSQHPPELQKIVDRAKEIGRENTADVNSINRLGAAHDNTVKGINAQTAAQKAENTSSLARNAVIGGLGAAATGVAAHRFAKARKKKMQKAASDDDESAHGRASFAKHVSRTRRAAALASAIPGGALGGTAAHLMGAGGKGKAVGAALGTVLGGLRGAAAFNRDEGQKDIGVARSLLKERLSRDAKANVKTAAKAKGIRRAGQLLSGSHLRELGKSTLKNVRKMDDPELHERAKELWNERGKVTAARSAAAVPLLVATHQLTKEKKASELDDSTIDRLYGLG